MDKSVPYFAASPKLDWITFLNIMKLRVDCANAGLAGDFTKPNCKFYGGHRRSTILIKHPLTCASINPQSTLQSRPKLI